jgi:hypothetical protein
MQLLIAVYGAPHNNCGRPHKLQVGPHKLLVEILAGVLTGTEIRAASLADEMARAAALLATNKPINNQGLTQVVRAWDKHDTTRLGGAFTPATGGVVDKNRNAAVFVENALNNPSTKITQLSGGAVKYRLPTGQGFRIEADGRFNFIDPNI